MNILFVIDKIELKYFEFNNLVTNFWFIKEFLERNNNVYITTNSRLYLKEAEAFTMCFESYLENNNIFYKKELHDLKVDDFEENFTNGKDSPIKWEEISFSREGVKLSVTPEFIKKASQVSLKEGSGFRGAKGVILNATSEALDDVLENEGKYEEVILVEETVDNPSVYKKVLKK